MANNITFDVAIPQAFKMPHLASTSKAIPGKVLQEFLPESQTSYSYGGTNRIHFRIASHHALLDFTESYFRFKVYRSVAGNDANVALDEGGVHALFKSITVREAATGTTLQIAEHYNRKYALDRAIYQSAESIQDCGWVYGDSVQGYTAPTLYQPNAAVTTFYDTSEGQVNATGVSFANSTSAEVGDLLVIIEAQATVLVSPILQVTSNTTLLVEKNLLVADFASTVNTRFYIIKNRQDYTGEGARSLVVKNALEANAKIVEFRPNMSIFNQSLPLFLLNGGIEVIFELDNPAVVLQHKITTADTITVADPRFMGMMLTPHPDIVTEITNQWRTEDGIVIPIPSYRVIRATRSNALDNDNLQLHPGVRSCNEVFVTVTDSTLAEGTDAVTRNAYSLSTFLRSNITSFQGRVGSEEYPRREVVCDTYSTEAFQQLKSIAQSQKFSFPDSAWYSINPIANGTTWLCNDSTKFIMGMDLSRDNGPGSYLTGKDVASVPFEFELKRSSTYSATGLPGSPLYFFWFQYDAFLSLSAGLITVRQ